MLEAAPKVVLRVTPEKSGIIELELQFHVNVSVYLFSMRFIMNYRLSERNDALTAAFTDSNSVRLSTDAN